MLSGERADDPLYLPAIARVRACLNRVGLLYVGDCKMAALATRGLLAAGQDYYLCPLSARQILPAVLHRAIDAVQHGTQPVEHLTRLAPRGRPIRPPRRSSRDRGEPSRRCTDRWRVPCASVG